MALVSRLPSLFFFWLLFRWLLSLLCFWDSHSEGLGSSSGSFLCVCLEFFCFFQDFVFFLLLLLEVCVWCLFVIFLFVCFEICARRLFCTFAVSSSSSPPRLRPSSPSSSHSPPPLPSHHLAHPVPCTSCRPRVLSTPPAPSSPTFPLPPLPLTSIGSHPPSVPRRGAGANNITTCYCLMLLNVSRRVRHHRADQAHASHRCQRARVPGSVATG